MIFILGLVILCSASAQDFKFSEVIEFRKAGNPVGTQYNDPFWLTPSTGDGNLVFWVNVAKDTEIEIDFVPAAITTDMHTLVIGAANNTQIIVLREAREMLTVSAKDVLTPGTLQAFWVKWDVSPGTITFGRGSVLDENPLGLYTSDAAFTVKGHTVSTIGPKTLSTFIIDKSKAQDLIYATQSNKESYVNLWWSEYNNRNQTLVKVRSYSDVYIMLTEKLDNVNLDQSYRIKIGLERNTVSYVYDGKTAVLLNETPGLLHGPEWQYFWIRWVGGTIDFGTGNRYGVGTVMSYTPSGGLRPINVLSITPAEGHTAEFMVNP